MTSMPRPRTIAGLYNEEAVVRPVTKSLVLRFGLEKADFIQQVHYRISDVSDRVSFSTDSKGEMRYWVCSTYAQWKEELPSPSERTVRRMIKDLEKQGIILSKEGKSRIKYYSIDYEKLEIALWGQKKSEWPKWPDMSGQSGHCKCRKWPDISAENGHSHNNIYIDKNNIEEDRGEENTSLSSLSHPQEDALPPKISLSVKKKKEPKLTELDENWSIPDTWRAPFLSAGVTNSFIDDSTNRFKAHHLGKGTTNKNWWYPWKLWLEKDCKGIGIIINIKSPPPPSVFVNQLSPKKNPPKEHPLSHKFIEKAREMIKADKDIFDMLPDGYFGKSDLRLVSIAAGKAFLWVNKEIYKMYFDSDPNYHFEFLTRQLFIRILKELDPTIEDIHTIEETMEVT